MMTKDTFAFLYDFSVLMAVLLLGLWSLAQIDAPIWTYACWGWIAPPIRNVLVGDHQ